MPALQRVVPVALKKAKPGTLEFREALMGEREITASQAVYNWTATDPYGVDRRARVFLTVKNGDWALVQ